MIVVNLNDIETIIDFIKTFFIICCTYVTFLKIINSTTYYDGKKIIGYLLMLFLSVIIVFIKDNTNFFISTAFLTIMLSVIGYITTGNNIGYSITITMISLAFNYSIYFIPVIITFFINIIIKIESDLINLLIILTIHTIFLIKILNTKRFKYGISFLQKNIGNESMDIFILNISAITLFSIIVFVNSDFIGGVNAAVGVITFSITILVTIQKSLQLYYKQKLLEKDLNETKEELAKKIKEVEELEAENLSISKKSHTLSHKQKSLEYKLQEIMAKAEISTEEAAEVRDRLKEIEKDLYKEKNTVKLDKTGIAQIDDMLEYMQSECKKNKIDFELQINGNIHFMTNNLISKEDLETLLADHIKNAIIAINHTDNINRSILVRLGEIDGIYSLYIYDSGIEFEKETLENLGKKPSTTHKDEGGTGMGFMNTFDTLRKCEASLIINEFNKPNKENYTKAIIIKFDKKNELKIISYR